MSINSELAAAIAEKLEVITTDDGYNTNLGSKVVTEPWQVQEEDLPVLAVVPGRFSRRGISTNHYERLIDITVQCSVPAGAKDANAKAGDAIDDVLRALPNTFTVDLTANTAEVEVQGGEILQRPGGLQFVVAQIALQARVRERSA